MKIEDIEDPLERESILAYLQMHMGKKKEYPLDIIQHDPTSKFRLYHISTNPKIPYFFPKFSTKIYPGENMQLARTSTSPSIGECIQGYGPIQKENEVGGWNNDKKNPFNGIYYIYEPLWKFSFKPNKDLVGDVKWSREHWLLYYRPELHKRPAKLSGCFFIKEMVTRYRGTGKSIDLTLYVKINRSDDVWFSKDILLKAGKFYKIELHDYKNPEFEYVLNENTFVDEISESNFQWSYGLRTKNNEKDGK